MIPHPPQAEALEDGAHGHGSTDKQPSRALGNYASTQARSAPDVTGQVTGAKKDVLRLAAELYSCPEACLPSSVADVKRALNQLEGLAGLGAADPGTGDPARSHNEALSNVLSVLSESEERELGLDTEFKIGQNKLKKLISEYVIANEAEAERVMEEFSADAGTKAAAFTTFNGTSVKVSAIRLAVFTGKRFLYSSCADMNGSDRAEVCVPALQSDEAVDIPARTSELELFLKLVKGQPPEKVALRDAIGLFSVIEYSMASALHSIWIRGMAPLLKQLSSNQMAVMVSAVLGYSLCCSPVGASPLTLMLSTWGDAVKHDKDSAWPDRDTGVGGSEAGVFAAKVLGRAGSGSAAHFESLLQISSTDDAPGWLRVGSIAASACCVRQASTDVTAACRASLHHVLLNFSGADAAAVLADACVRAPHQAQRRHVGALSAAVVEHMTKKFHKRYLWFTARTVVDSPVLSEPASRGEDSQLICLPLSKKDCFLFAARVLCEGQTTVNRNWALQLQPCCSRSGSNPPPHVPHVGLYLHNILHHARKVQYALGFMPVDQVEQVCPALRKIGQAFSSNGFNGLKTNMVGETPVFVSMEVATITPLGALGFPWLEASPGIDEKWQAVAGAGWKDGRVKQKEVVAFCVLDESPA